MKTEKVTFPTLLGYLFDIEENPRIAGAAHIKIGMAPNQAAFPGEVLLVSLDGERQIEAMFAFDGASALEPITVEYVLDGE